MSTTATKTGRSLKERGLVRLTADVPADDMNLLDAIARKTGYNKVTTIVRALRVLGALEDATRDGGDVQIIHKDGTKERLLIR